MQNNKSASLASKARLKAGLKETSFQACSVYSGGASHSRHLEPGYALFGNVVFWKFFGHHYAFALVLCVRTVSKHTRHRSKNTSDTGRTQIKNTHKSSENTDKHTKTQIKKISAKFELSERSFLSRELRSSCQKPTKVPSTAERKRGMLDSLTGEESLLTYVS